MRSVSALRARASGLARERLRPQVEEQGAADQTEAEVRRNEGDQHDGREDRENSE